MDKIISDILNNINEGLVLIDQRLNICIWNKYMEYLTGINAENAIDNNIYEILPNLTRKYLKSSISNVMDNGLKMFFSSSMHGKLVNDRENLNLKISRFDYNNSKVLVLEFLDVTSQFIQVDRLKKYVTKLCELNKKLKEKEEVIKNLAYYDKLTGAANRTLFYEFSEKFLSVAKRNNTALGLMFTDIDKFKKINDTYGHEIGDRVLTKVANILKKATRKEDAVTRYGGDEFLILLPNIKNLSDCETIACRILRIKNNFIICNGNEIPISLSIGISCYPKDGVDIDSLIVKADKAMYRAKKSGGNCNCFCK